MSFRKSTASATSQVDLPTPNFPNMPSISSLSPMLGMILSTFSHHHENEWMYDGSVNQVQVKYPSKKDYEKTCQFA